MSKISELILKSFLIFITFSYIATADAEVSFGNSKGKVVLVEYFDYNCPVCRAYMPTIHQLAHKNSELKVVQRVIPVFGQSSQIVDRAVLASFFQGKFAQMQRAILSVRDSEKIPSKEVFLIGKSLNLNLRKLYQDMNSDRVKNQLVSNIKSFMKTRQNRVPVIVLYNANSQKQKLTFVGAQSITTLQQAINTLQKHNLSSNHKEFSRDKK